jgi:pimeloyl-ACP methyl ester carboxylesterase
MVPLPGPLEMSVLSADGLVLKGILEYPEVVPGAGFPLAIFAHQYPATADSFAPLIDDLLDLGIACLAFDLRGHGASIMGPSGPIVIDTPVGFTGEDFGRAFMSSATKVGFDRIDDDIIRVASWGVAQNFIDPGRVLLIGGSIGGSAVLLAAPRIPGLQGIITLGAAGVPVLGANASDRIRTALETISVRALLASSEEDPFAGGENVRTWSHGLPRIAARLVTGTAHAMAIYYDVRSDVLAFVKATALKD